MSGLSGQKPTPQMSSVEMTLPTASTTNTTNAVSGSTFRRLRPRLGARELPVVKQQNGAADDHQGKGDERPGVEMQPKDRVAV